MKHLKTKTVLGNPSTICISKYEIINIVIIAELFYPTLKKRSKFVTDS